jgi:cytochrome c-type biogenesis protein CcmH
MKRKIVVLTFLFLWIVPNFSFAAFTYNSKEFTHVIEQLDMQGHADHDLSTCSVKKIYYEEVVDMLNEGKSQNDIIKSYVDEYGQAALRTPGTSWAGIFAWAMPAVGLLLGLWIVIKGMQKFTFKAKDSIETSPAPLQWQNDIEREIFEKTMDEERRKLF